MKKTLLFFLLLLLLSTEKIFSQTSATLSGYPIVTTGWILGGTAAAIDSEIRLTTSGGSQTGYVYYNTTLNVTSCGSFTVDFDMKITAAGGCGLADGIAFYFINPMTAFVTGGGLGLPNPLTGYALTLDTWDNDGDALNPEVQMFGYATASTYNEGDAVHRIGSILGSQSWMGDGAWHHVHITYNGGTIRVYLNGSATVAVTGSFPINTAGYFGFSASTGCGYSTQYVKSVFINSNTISPILGTTTICAGSTTTLSDSTSGGTWSSSNPSVATVGSTTGVVTGVATGTSVISYTYNTGTCTATTTVTVVSPPSAITGTTTICTGLTSTLSDATPGGTWSSSSTGIATVGSTTGVVTGVSAGTAVITYSTGGACYVTTTVNVITTPAPIAGPSAVCTGYTITLTDATGGGTWTSSATGIATVGATTGIVTGVSSGVVTISYSIGACVATKSITVNPSPGAISGPTGVCVGSTITLTDPTAGGTWSSSNPAIGSVGVGTGVVTGVSAGTIVISYTLAGGCYATYNVTVNALPCAITGFSIVCVASSTTLTSCGAGTWSSSAPAIGTVGSTTGVVTGISAGTTTITFTNTNGCYRIFVMTVNPLPGPITGSHTVCVGSLDTLADTSIGGIWSSSDPSVAYIDPTGVVTGISPGTATISYTLGGGLGCMTTFTVTVNPGANPITGVPVVCVGRTTTLFDIGGGTWSSSAPGTGSIDPLTGVVTGISPGMTLITYTLGTGCTATMPVTVNPAPGAITGTLIVCVGQTTALASTPTGGTWGSSTPAVGTISPTGIVTGITGGVTTVTYTLPTGCYTTAVVTVNTTSTPILGVLQVCVGGTTTLTDATPGGTWTSSAPAVATIGGTTGVVNGIAAGTSVITYMLPSGCFNTATVTVNGLPTTITGPGTVCMGLSVTLSSTPAGGTWTSSVPGIATIGSSTGIAVGITAGVTTITYTLGTGCIRTRGLTVNAVPAGISGPPVVCVGQTITLTDATPGGGWSSMSPGVATIGSTGVVTGVSAGTSLISYTLATGCASTMIVTVNGLPTLYTVTGGGAYCAGGPGVVIGLSGSTLGASYQLYNGVATVGSPVIGTGGALSFGLQTAAGVYTVVATAAGTGCTRTMSGSVTVTVNPVPTPITGASAVCMGSTTTESSSPAGGTWTSSAPGIATVGGTTGIVSGITTGTVTIVYTLPTTCSTSKVMTVSLAPGPIGGPLTACTGTSTTVLTDAVGGGLWTSSAPGIAGIGSSSGIVTAVTTGTVTITYSLGGSGCTVTRGLTVNASPLPVSGSAAVCIGGTTTLGSSAGVIWSSSAPAVATVGSTTGVVSGISAGSTTIAATNAVGCTAILPFTVNPLPTVITGPPAVCVGAQVTLTDSVGGGTWTSSAPLTAGIGSASGVVTGIAAGTVTITYSLGTGCTKTRTETVNPLPGAISGSSQLCVGLNTTYTDGTPGGVWSSLYPAIGTISTSGVLTAITAGTDTILYTLPATGCAAAKPVTINPLPAPVSGSPSVCVGQTTVLGDAVPGGTWTSANPATATVGSSSGVVTGVAMGMTTITYTAGGCYTTIMVTVIATPLPITGPPNVCVGGTITLADATPGGTWSSGDALTATIGATTGVVSGITSGTVIMSYTLGSGCTSVLPVIINPVSPILPAPPVCTGQSTTLVDTSLGGVWTSSNPLIATIGSTTGIITGVSAGMVTISYTMPTGCVATALITVNTTPGPVSGPGQVCAGQNIIVSDPTPGGTWTSANTLVATATTTTTTTGTVTGVSAGVTTISYTMATGCAATRTVTVNAIPAAITGPTNVCVGGTVGLSDATPGGSWGTTAPAVATVTMTGGVVSGISAGTAVIVYTLPTGCSNTVTMNVSPAVGALTGPMNYCVGATILLTSATPGGTWTSSNPAVVSPAMVCMGAGTAVITYSLGAGCTATAVVTVVNPPAAIGGSTTVCQGQTTILTDATPGGVWSTSDPLTADIGSTSGIVTGVAAGIATISYTAATLGSGCTVTHPMTVMAGPAAIMGIASVCVGQTTPLTDATPGGIWTSSSPATATVSSTGVVTGVATGTATISYTIPGTGCAALLSVTVNTMPGTIAGTLSVCEGQTTALTDAPGGGVWTSSNPAAAPVGATTGVVSGVSAAAGGGITMITYSLGAGCDAIAIVTVNPVPAAVSGPSAVCATQNITLTDPTAGGTWSSTVPAIGTVDPSGIVTGIAAGTTVISYTNPYGCASTKTVTVNTMPGTILGSGNVCIGGTATLSDSVTGGTWLSTNTAVATIGVSSGIITGIALGTTTVIYQVLPGGCFTMRTINVVPLPAVYTVTGGGNHCSGDTGVHIYLSGSAVGVNYMLYRGPTAVGAFPGTGSPLDLGPETLTGTYTVIGTSTATGCSIAMAGSAVVYTIPSVVPTVSLHATPNDTVCAGTSVTFTPVITYGGTLPTYRWQVNGVPVALTATYTFIPADGDIVTAVLSSNAQCATPDTATGTLKMTVQPFTRPTVDIAITPNDTVCKGTVVTAAAVPGYGGTAPYYTWIKNGVPYGGAAGTYAWVPGDNDRLYVVMNSNYPCRLDNSDTATEVRITVDTPKMPVVTITATPGYTISKGEPDTLTATVTNADNPTYQWYVNGVPVTGATTATWVSSTFSYPDQDSVSCRVTSNGVCRETGHQWLYIQVTAVGVQQLTQAGGEITVMPNPNQGSFDVKGSLGIQTDQQVTLELTDVLGQVVYKAGAVAKGGKLNEHIKPGNLANGMYLLSVRTDSGTRVFHVVVEQ